MKYISVPYFEQSTDYSCGPAAVRMLLRFFGMERSEEELMVHLETNEDVGTSHETILEFLNREGLNCIATANATYEDLLHVLREGIPALVRYCEPDTDTDHYALVVAAHDGGVTLHDPWPGNGAHMMLEREEFLRRWQNETGATCNWMLAATSGQ
jgi:predicted double-glycine peptidase